MIPLKALILAKETWEREVFMTLTGHVERLTPRSISLDPIPCHNGIIHFIHCEHLATMVEVEDVTTDQVPLGALRPRVMLELIRQLETKS
jgi:hypothetical protein